MCSSGVVKQNKLLLYHQFWGTGWNEKYPNGSTMKDRSDDPSHHERTLLPGSYISVPWIIQRHGIKIDIVKNPLN